VGGDDGRPGPNNGHGTSVPAPLSLGCNSTGSEASKSQSAAPESDLYCDLGPLLG